MEFKWIQFNSGCFKQVLDVDSIFDGTSSVPWGISPPWLRRKGLGPWCNMESVKGLAEGSMSRSIQGKPLVAWVSEFAWNPWRRGKQKCNIYPTNKCARGSGESGEDSAAKPQEKHGIKWPTKNQVMQVPRCAVCGHWDWSSWARG